MRHNVAGWIARIDERHGSHFQTLFFRPGEFSFQFVSGDGPVERLV